MPIFDHKWLQWTLWPLSLLYGGVMAVRNTAYDRGWLPSYSVDALVISIGNLSVGGTGKTPVTQFLSETLSHAGYRVGILSRGYGRRSRGSVLVSRGDGPLCSPLESGDEPYWLALRTRHVPVLVDEDRVRGATTLIREHGVQIILLDDGFQHRRLRRNLDLVLFDPQQYRRAPFLLPAGYFREPLRSLRRAHWLGNTGDELPSRIKRHFHGRIFRIQFKPVSVWEPLNQTRLSTDILKKAQVVAVAGIAQPQRFFTMLERLEANILKKSAFRDHYKYRKTDWQTLQQQIRDFRADAIVTTAKDWMRLESLIQPDEGTVWVLDIGVQVEAEVLKAFVEEVRKRLA